MVTGVIALLRSAYPDLTWRDVKLIIAESAKKILPDKEGYSASGYQKSGYMYHDRNKKQKYHRLSGFGLIDATTAFELAKNWKPLPAMKKEEYYSKELSPAAKADSNGKFETLSLEVKNSTITFIEFVNLEIKFTLKPIHIPVFFGKMSLISSDGTEAKFYDATIPQPQGKDKYYLSGLESVQLKTTMTMMNVLSNRFLGNNSINGTWKLKIEDRSYGRQIAFDTITSWKITIRGH